jgi:hypothetical protein
MSQDYQHWNGAQGSVLQQEAIWIAKRLEYRGSFLLILPPAQIFVSKEELLV